MVIPDLTEANDDIDDVLINSPLPISSDIWENLEFLRWFLPTYKFLYSLLREIIVCDKYKIKKAERCITGQLR